MRETAAPEETSSLTNRIWRWLATGFFFALFGIGGLLLSIIWFTLLRLIIRQPEKLHRMTLNSIRNSFRFFLAGLRLVGVMDYRFTGDEKFQQDAGCLIVANHPSLLDYVILASRMPRCDCIVKQALLRNPFLRGVIKAAGYLINSGSDALLQACDTRLKAGGTLLVFPEGTRTLPDKPMTLQRGAANIALRAGCDIRIVHISCQPPMLTKKGKWYQIPKAKPQFVITVGEKIKANNFLAESDLSPALAARRLTQHLRTELMRSNTQNNEK
ncbi:lysophospholipid acyltransferase family protein [Rahnella victoriana]|uniref:lysophospholipid acyltransferase family protein n=1 Tax=Rahnella victoriana TaxID=1510570 RepID=UPI001039C8EA|nr:lysophospholipid acyltransferase family protein [Rahnella victoriana]TBX36589.1 1-acyl-sn-glycerol-3-phosphate acyltransferase [Rahnella victoriana]